MTIKSTPFLLFYGRHLTNPPESELFMGWGEILKGGVADTESGLALSEVRG
jgi:hypothetical protein